MEDGAGTEAGIKTTGGGEAAVKSKKRRNDVIENSAVGITTELRDETKSICLELDSSIRKLNYTPTQTSSALASGDVRIQAALEEQNALTRTKRRMDVINSKMDYCKYILATPSFGPEKKKWAEDFMHDLVMTQMTDVENNH
jgi:hypothetical protein